MSDDLRLIDGAAAVDDRGTVRFCNDFDMAEVKRFYVVTNHAPRFIRAWHAHKNEKKYAYVASGAALFAAVKIDNWESPDKSAQIHRFTLAEDKPGVLRVPGGYANGFMTLRPDTRIFFFATASLNESLNDDFRYTFDHWDPWSVVPR